MTPTGPGRNKLKKEGNLLRGRSSGLALLQVFYGLDGILALCSGHMQASLRPSPAPWQPGPPAKRQAEFTSLVHIFQIPFGGKGILHVRDDGVSL